MWCRHLWLSGICCKYPPGYINCSIFTSLAVLPHTHTYFLSASPSVYHTPTHGKSHRYLKWLIEVWSWCKAFPSKLIFSSLRASLEQTASSMTLEVISSLITWSCCFLGQRGGALEAAAAPPHTSLSHKATVVSNKHRDCRVCPLRREHIFLQRCVCVDGRWGRSFVPGQMDCPCACGCLCQTLCFTRRSVMNISALLMGSLSFWTLFSCCYCGENSQNPSARCLFIMIVLRFLCVSVGASLLLHQLSYLTPCCPDVCTEWPPVEVH